MLTQEKVKDLFSYIDGKLYWNTTGKGRKLSGIVGSLDGIGYLRTTINYKRYRIHQLVYLMHHGYIPKYIDHIDGNKLNNSIENLRECTQSQNCMNQKMKQNSKSGVKGVYWSKSMKKWAGEIIVKRQRVYRDYFDTLEEAATKMELARNKLHGTYAKLK